DVDYLRKLNDEKVNKILDAKEDSKTLNLKNNDSADAILKILDQRDRSESEKALDFLDKQKVDKDGVISKTETTEITPESKSLDDIQNEAMDEFRDKTPEDLASMYEDEVDNPTSLSDTERAISEWGGTEFNVTRESYMR